MIIRAGKYETFVELPELPLTVFSFSCFMLSASVFDCAVYLSKLVSNNLYVKMAKQYKVKTYISHCYLILYFQVFFFLKTAFPNIRLC